MISAGVEGRLPYMTYSEPWSRNPPKQPSEVFLRPAPKLLPPPPTNRTFNGVPVSCSYPNGTRIVPSRPISKYPSPPPSSIPVNLTQQPKEEINKEEPLSPYSRYLFPPSPQYSPYGYPALCQPSYILRTPTFPPTPLSPQEIFSPATPTASSTGTFLSPPTTFSPPSTTVVVVKPGAQTSLRRGSSPLNSPLLPHSPNFKVPSGKEGSLKHRLLVEASTRASSGPLDLQKPPEGRRRLAAAVASPPPVRSPKRHLNNNTVPANFQKGQLIQLANGEFKKIEEMRTEDFVQSAEKCPSLKLAESTVVKIGEGKEGHVTVTLTYDQRRAQVEIDSTLEHPYFVMGHGWASCNPDRTLQVYGLKVHRLQVGDVMVSVTPREPPPPPISTNNNNPSRSTTIMTTATTTAMSSRQYSRIAPTSTVTSSGTTTNNNNHMPPSSSHHHHHSRPLSHSPPKSLMVPASSSSTLNYYAQMTPLQLDAESRKRRWSAPEVVDEEDQLVRRSRVE